MFKKYFIILLYLLLAIPCVSWAGWLPHILAICKVELKDGSIIEGVTYVARARFDRYYNANGFYMTITLKEDSIHEAKSAGKVVYFNTNFYAIQPYKGVIERSPTMSSGIGSRFQVQKLYYLRDVTNKYHSSNVAETTEFDTSNSSLILKHDFTGYTTCELLDYIPIFPKVTEELLFGREVKSTKSLDIAVENVERFELVLEPSQKWFKEIETTEKAYLKKCSETPGMIDVPIPLWWHDIMEKKDRYENEFKPWQRKYWVTYNEM